MIDPSFFVETWFTLYFWKSDNYITFFFFVAPWTFFYSLHFHFSGSTLNYCNFLQRNHTTVILSSFLFFFRDKSTFRIFNPFWEHDSVLYCYTEKQKRLFLKILQIQINISHLPLEVQFIPCKHYFVNIIKWRNSLVIIM